METVLRGTTFRAAIWGVGHFLLDQPRAPELGLGKGLPRYAGPRAELIRAIISAPGTPPGTPAPPPAPELE